jgi:hypothetical protein
MNRARILAASALLASTTLAACHGLHTPSAAEQGAKKISQASAKARALAHRIAFSPDAVSKQLPVEGGEPKEIAQPLLAPAEAAKELRTLAGEVASAGATDSQRREAKTLATRMRRDALMLDLMDLERIAQLKGTIALEIEGRLAAICSIEASGDLTSTETAAARVTAARGGKAALESAVAMEHKRADDARAAMKPLEDTAADKTKEAEALDIEIQTLRAEAATSAPSKALPKMIEARQKLDEAQDRRVAASAAERDADQYRSTVRIVESATAGNDEISSFLDARVEEAKKAEEGAKARAGAAGKRATELAGEAAAKAQEFAKIQSELYEPALKNVAENFSGGDITSKNPTDAAAIAFAKARFAAIQVDAVDQLMIIGKAAQAAGGKDAAGAIDALRVQRDKLLGEAKAALVEARDGLSGTEGTSAKPMLDAVSQLASALKIDITKPAEKPAAEEKPADAKPAEDAKPAADAPPVADAKPAGDAKPAPGATPPAGTPSSQPDEPNK